MTVWTNDETGGTVWSENEAAGTALGATTGSSLVGFIHSGSGASATTVQAELRRIYERSFFTSLTLPSAFLTAWGSTPPILPKFGPNGWRGDISVRSLMPSLGSVTYYVDNANGSDSAIGIALTITGITNAATAVVSYTGTDPSNTHRVYINEVGGATEANGRYFSIANVNAGANTFELSGIDSSAWGVYTSGGVAIVPLKGIDVALAKNTATSIFVAPGLYQRDDDWGSTSPATSSSTLVVQRWPIRSGPVISGAFWNHSASSWTQDVTHTLTYTASRTLVTAVRDYSLRTEDGEHLPFFLAQSASDCNSKRGSYYTDGSDVWVHMWDDGPPGEQIRIFLAESGATFVTTKTIYIEGIEFHGGNAAFRPRNTGGTSAGRVYVKDCKFLYGNASATGAGVQCEGISLLILEDCEVAFNLTDGIDYNIDNGISPKGIEVNCHSHHNGRDRSGINNGSTAHNSSVVLRIGGNYHHNEGPNIADVGAGSSMCVGSSAHDSVRYETGITKADFYNSAGSMWLYDCTAYGSDNSLTTTSGGTTYHDRFGYGDSLTESGGTITTYTQT